MDNGTTSNDPNDTNVNNPMPADQPAATPPADQGSMPADSGMPAPVDTPTADNGGDSADVSGDTNENGGDNQVPPADMTPPADQPAV